MVAAGGVARDQFAQEAGEEELGAQNHCRQCKVEVGGVRDQGVRIAGIHVVEFERSHDDHSDEAQQEHQTAQQAEEVHRLDTELRLEPQREQIQVAVDKAVETKL